MRAVTAVLLAGIAAASAACRTGDEAPRASGYVEAVEVRVAAEVGGRVVEMAADEGRRVAAGDVLARLDTGDLEIALRRAEAERDQATAQLRLLQAGARTEDVGEARAQADSARAEVAAAEADLEAAAEDLRRFDALLAANAGSRKQRDDAAARVSVATAKVRAARDRARAAAQGVARLRAGARREELAAAEARVAVTSAQVAAVQKNIADATVTAPVAGTVTSKLVDAGETIAARTPLVVLSDLDHAWANVYVDGPLVPHLTLGQAATLITDGGHRIPGTITYISPRAEFTPRNVQTAEERSKLVYRIKVTVDNREGILKPGMPVEADLGHSGDTEETQKKHRRNTEENTGATYPDIRKDEDSCVLNSVEPWPGAWGSPISSRLVIRRQMDVLNRVEPWHLVCVSMFRFCVSSVFLLWLWLWL